MINSLLWTPLAFGLIGLFLPKRFAGWWAVLGTAVTAGIAITLLAGFDSGAAGLQDTVDVNWIPGLGVDYSLGIDGLNVFLVLLTAVVWLGGTAFAAFREQERPHLFFLMMLLGETATLGAFVAQDLLLFVLFFDLMLVPFYFLFGGWGSDREGGPTASAATLKMIVYTLIGSLLMLVGRSPPQSSPPTGHITFSIANLPNTHWRGGQLDLLVLRRRLLVKMPPSSCGWMPDAYRAAPPALAVFSGCWPRSAPASLRVVLPLFPARRSNSGGDPGHRQPRSSTAQWPSQTNVDCRRLLSVAQLGFITAGIFAFRRWGRRRVLQMVNRPSGCAAFVIVALLAERSGTEDLREMGGMATKAPVLAALFLIVTLATLAMPGSANFIGEFFILNGLFDSKIVFAFVAISGVAMSAYYALRLYQRTMHNREPPERRADQLRDGGPGAAGALHHRPGAMPQLILKRTDEGLQRTWHRRRRRSGEAPAYSPSRVPRRKR
jgi:NADH-quinone oxidoreductase subunit M